MAASSSSHEPADSLYSHEQRATNDANVPWWQRNFLLHQPVLFGTWDGVFTTVMVNIFGIIVFLRMGWIVGTAGVGNSILLLFFCAALALITVLSAVGICERCQIQSGGIYFLVSHILGGQLGGAVGLIYAFGQAVATGLVAVGFGESVAQFFASDSPTLIKVIAISTLLILTAVNTAGVSWVIRLQLLLLGFLGLAVIDFLLGSLWTVDPEHGVGHFSAQRFQENAKPHYEATNCTALVGIELQLPSQSIFTVFGVFFANFLGVLAGVNMSGDLKEPHKSIPLGELSAVGVSTGICFVFILVLGSAVERPFLLCDRLISERVSLTGVLFLAGLYISSLSSTIGSLLGTPRVIQGIAQEGIIPILNPLAQGVGPNKNPVLAGLAMMIVACVFVLLGDLNQLAILSTMPFLITYAYVNYAYVSLAMSYDLDSVNEAAATEQKSTYGSMHNIAGSQAQSDLDQLFPERQQALGSQASTSHTVEGQPIIGQPTTWYSMFSNRYIAFVGALINIAILLFVHFWWAIAHFVALALLYYYIGRVCPAVFPGITKFSLPHMFKTAFSSLEQIGVLPQSTLIVGGAGSGPGGEISTAPLNEPNPDYADRKQYHRAEQLQNDFD